MNILENVLHYCAPPEWEDTTKNDYSNVRYLLFEVGVGSKEHAAEVDSFVNGEPKINVKKIQRVQNPYQLGRFVLRQEQKKYRGENLQVVKYYHPLRTNDLEIALEHNMDVRRYGSRHSGQVSSQNPTFYKTPGLAYNSVQPCDIILICNVLGKSFEGSVTHKTNDTEYMPTYVVTVA